MTYLKNTQTNKKKGTVKSERKRLIKHLDDLIREIVCKEKICCCCGKFTEKIQPGHFVTRQIYALRWDLKNLAPQCPGCNMRHEWDPSPYASYLLKRDGVTAIDDLIQKKNNAPKTTVLTMRETEEYLKGLL